MKPIVTYWPNKVKASEKYFIKCMLHREDGPAYKSWYDNGQLGLVQYCIYGKLHRLDGPAYSRWNKSGKRIFELYSIDDLYHRIDGPAYLEWFNGGKVKYADYFVNGIKIVPDWFTQVGKDINKDFTDDAVRNMILNIYGVSI